MGEIVKPTVTAEIVMSGPKDNYGASDVDVFGSDFETCGKCPYIKRGDFGQVYSISRVNPCRLHIRAHSDEEIIKDAEWWKQVLTKAACQPKVEVRDEPWPEGMK
jgi:hypothetical protein